MLGKIEGRREGDDRGCNGWVHHWLDEHEFEQALGIGDGQGSLVCWGYKELDTTERLNWLNWILDTLFLQILEALNFPF